MLTLTRILCPTDFSDVSRHAEAYATAMAGHYDASLHLLHVDPPMPVMAPYGEIPVDIRLFEEQRQQAVADLAAARQRAANAGVVADTMIRGGHPAREILAVTAELAADLLVLGTHGRGGVEHLLLGSVAEKIVRKAPCPVMVVPPAARPETGVLFSRILCPVDGSAASADAVAFALSLARETDGHLTLLYVVEPVPASGEFGALDVEEYRKLGEAHARKVLADAVPPEVREWCRVDETVAIGKASERIVDAAKTGHADVIVMGVRGRGAIDLLAFGSTTNDVIRRAECPVIAVHPRATDHRGYAPAPASAVV
ncbi:MAG: universal stress protein [Vicinamibacterales bacterium]